MRTRQGANHGIAVISSLFIISMSPRLPLGDDTDSYLVFSFFSLATDGIAVLYHQRSLSVKSGETPHGGTSTL